MRSTLILFLALSTGALAACGENDAAPAEPETPLAARYALVSVDGGAAPLLIGEFRYPSGTEQKYLLAYDSLYLDPAAKIRRSFLLRVETRDENGSRVLPLLSAVRYDARFTRSGDRVIVEYVDTDSPVKPDTFRLESGNLVKLGPYGVACPTCPPVRRVEYIYAPL